MNYHRYFFILVVACFLSACSKCDDVLVDGYQDTSEWVLDTDSTSIKEVLTAWGGQMSIREDVVYKANAKLRKIYRIPSLVITNNGTLLLSCENRDEELDKGEMDILIARKSEDDTQWEVRRVIKQDDSYGRSMNPVFVIDRMGAHERKGRVYLFASHENNIQGYTDQTSTDDSDIVYKYSDDDGKTWSSETSLKNLWNLNDYDLNIPSACNGIQLDDGTLLMPTMAIRKGNWRSGLLMKKPGQEWRFTRTTPKDGDNECSVYIDTEKRIILDCRTTDKVHRKYVFDINSEEFSLLPDEISVYNDLKAEITKLDGEKSFYMTTYVDVKSDTREDLTLLASEDGWKWNKIYKLQKGFNAFGYGNVTSWQGRTFVAFEDYQDNNIKVHELTPFVEKIGDYIGIQK